MYLKKWSHGSRLSSHSRSSVTFDLMFLLIIYSNHGSISYRFRDKRRFRSKIAIFHTSSCVAQCRHFQEEA